MSKEINPDDCGQDLDRIINKILPEKVSLIILDFIVFIDFKCLGSCQKI